MEKLNTILQDAVATGEDTTGKVAGAAFVVTNKDEFLYSGAAGRNKIDVASTAFTHDSFSLIASMTKVVTSACVLQLVDKGVLDLDEDVRPKFPYMQTLQVIRGFKDDGEAILEENTEPISLRRLLTHTSGFSYPFSNPRGYQWSLRPDRTDKFPDRSLEAISAPLVYAPNEYWNYGTGLDWAGELIALATGASLGSYMQEHIFAPLGMRDTGFWPSKLPHTADRLVEDTRRRDGKLVSCGPLEEDWTMESGGGGLFSTANDYAKFLQGLLAGKVLSDKMLDLLCEPQLNEKQTRGIENFAYGFGVHGIIAPEFPKFTKLQQSMGGMINVEDVPGKRRAGSISWSGSSGPRWWLDRKAGIAAVMVGNVIEWDPTGDNDNAPPLSALWQKLEEAAYGDLLK